MANLKFMAILVLALAVVVWGQRGAQASFIEEFVDPGSISYTGSNPYGNGGSYIIAGGKLNITTGNNNTFSVMTTDSMPFDVNDTLCLDVPARSGSQGVFMMCSTSDLQPNGTTSFGFRFRRDGSGLRIELPPEVPPAGAIDPAPDKPATLIIKRTSDTDFDYAIRIEGVRTNLGSFTLANLSGVYNLHVGVQAFDTVIHTFVFDNLTIQPIRMIHNITKDTLYDTIQLSIDGAGAGDQIEVFPGRYYEAIDFKGKTIKLFSSDGPVGTVINGNGAHHVVQCISGEDANTILDGFTIMGGNAKGGGFDFSNVGGGILNYNSSPTIANCNFSSNTAEYGGGLGNYNSSPTFNNCTFTSNSALTGGGIANSQSSPTVNNCKFFYNSSMGHGGGIYNADSDPLVINCIFNHNSASLHGGGMMNNDSSSPTVANCIFYGNTARTGGGGLANSPANGTVVTNCTFYANTAIYGGGIYNYNSSSTITSCILWGNTPDELNNSEFSSPAVTYSDIAGDFSGTGNINEDPRFANIGNIFLRLSPDSPCIDAGDSNELIDAGISQDLTGLKRFVDFVEIPDSGAGPLTFVDMGAIELNYFSSKPFIINDADGVPVSFSLKGGGWGEITGTADLRRLILYNTTEKSQLNILTKGKTETSIGDITCDGPLKGISAKNVNLRGNLTVNDTLGTLILNDATNSTISIGPSANLKAAVTMKFDRVSNLTINSVMPVKSVTATAWHDGFLLAPSVGSITAKGDKKRGILGDLYVDVDVAGGIGAVKAKDTIFGDWICNSIKSISANEFYTTNITLNQLPDAKIPALGKLTAGYMYNSRIRSKGNMGSVKTGTMINSSCFAGIAEGITGLPEAADSSFIQKATIKSIAIKGIKYEEYCCINSNIAAANILSATIAYPQNDNGGVPFGITADYIKKLTIKDADGSVSLKELDKPGDGGGPYGNAQIRLY